MRCRPSDAPNAVEKRASAEEGAAAGGDSSMFGLTLEQLKSLMKLRGKDLLERLNSPEYNGINGILEKLKVDGNKGLDSNNEQDLEQRCAAYERNEIPLKPIKSFIRLCWDALHDMLLIILLVYAIFSIGLSFYEPPQESFEPVLKEPNLEWIEGVVILVAVLVVVFVTAITNWRQERQFRDLQSKIEKHRQTSVLRDNHIQQIPVTDLVVGDLCFIKYGDLLPADGLRVQSSDLEIDESSLTGETDLIKKGEGEDIGLLSGTYVMEGSGRMVVVGVGLNSQTGNITSLLGATEGGKDTKAKKKDKKSKKATPSATKPSLDLSKQSAKIEEENKPMLTTTTDENSPAPQSGLTQESNVDARQESTTNREGGMAKLADVEENEEDNPVTDLKHKCNEYEEF